MHPMKRSRKRPLDSCHDGNCHNDNFDNCCCLDRRKYQSFFICSRIWRYILVLTITTTTSFPINKGTFVVAWSSVSNTKSTGLSSKWTMMSTDSRELRFFHTRTTIHGGRSSNCGTIFQSPFQHSSSQQQHHHHQFGLWQELSSTLTSSSSSRSATTTGGGSNTMEKEESSAPMQMALSAVILSNNIIASVLEGAKNPMIVSPNLSVPFFTFPNNNEGKDMDSEALGRPPKTSSSARKVPQQQRVPQTGYGPSIQLTNEERELFQLLRRVREETGLMTTLRVAGGWVRDKLLATPEFQAYHKVFEIGTNSQTARLTSKFRSSSPKTSLGRLGTKVLVNPQNHGQPVDIDIALDDMLGREFADHLNEYLLANGKDEVSVGVVLKNPEKSKHLETATMKVGSFWIDFVNLRAEEYTQDSRIPDLMRIGTADEDAHRRDLTINSLYYNINTGQVEDWTGRGFSDLRKGVVSTPLPPLTTLLDDPLRILRSIRFAARLRFTMDPDLIEAAQTRSVALALSQKVSRERIGGELDLMLRSPDPVGAVRLLINLRLADCVFPVAPYFRDIILEQIKSKNGSLKIPQEKLDAAVFHMVNNFFERGINLLSTAHDHLADCRWSPPIWCIHKKSVYGANEKRLIDDEETRRLLWYAAFLKPLYDDFKLQHANSKKVPKRQEGSRKCNRSIVSRILVDELKRPIRDADAIVRIMKAADDFTQLLIAGCDVSATMILLSSVRVSYVTSTMDVEEYCDIETGTCENGSLLCSMNGRIVNSVTEDDPVWEHAMEFRLLCSKVMQQIGPLWRAALFLAISEELVRFEKQDGLEYAIEGDIIDETNSELRQGAMERFDSFAAALQQIGLVGIWNEKPLIDGENVRKVLPNLPNGPAFREVMDEQLNWMITHPGASRKDIEAHLMSTFPDFTEQAKVATEKIDKLV